MEALVQALVQALRQALSKIGEPFDSCSQGGLALFGRVQLDLFSMTNR